MVPDTNAFNFLKPLTFWLILSSLMLASCATGIPTTAPTAGGLATATSVITVTKQPVVTLAPTTAPARTLTICMGQEPSSLYIYGGSSRSMWSVLEAIYDGPFDTRNFSAQPVILEKLPSISGGDAVLTPVEVKSGDIIVNAGGELVSLAAGVKVLPAGCSGTDCASIWDGKKVLKLDQIKVTYKLLPELKWSDGQPLTAADSVFSYALAASADTPVSKKVVDRTDSYRATDPRTVEWVGVAGYVPARLESLFFQPLPQHAWGKLKPAELLTADISSRKPLGWGPYILDEWQTGKQIRLKKNPLYFRAAEGLPKFDILVYKFLGEQGDNNLAALQKGECDLVDQTALLDDQLEELVVFSNNKKLNLYVGQGPEWEHLDFGIIPAAFDDGYQPSKDRPDFFGDLRVRQAFTACLDRQAIIQGALYNRSSIPGGYLPPSHPLFQPELIPQPHDPVAGSKLLDEAGWIDHDANPATPRLYQGSSSIPKGTPLALTYAISDAPLRVKAANLAIKSLAECGIQATVKSYNVGELYAPGPAGMLFGRKFDLTQFAWEAGSQPACFLFEGSQTPTAKNNWVGVNISGFTNPAYDAACQKASQTRPENPDYAKNQQEAQKLFSQGLPVIPLYFHVKIAIARPDFCGMDMDVTTRSAIWGLERFEVGNCPK